MYILNFIRGFFMAIADSVPGVSGGTIAFIMGFYDRFINSINDLIYGEMTKKKEAVIFLLKIGIGWMIGMVLSILFITSVFEEHIYQISSLFLGLIIAAIPFIIIQEKDNLKDKYINILFTFLGIFIVFLITYFNPVTNGNGSTNDLENLTFFMALFIIFAGMVAISAMVLPGISGSTILLIFGLYAGILNAVKELLSFNFDYFFIVLLFGFGILLGVLLVIKLVRNALKNYRVQTIYLIIGLMIGSLYAVIEGPKTLENPVDSLSFDSFSILFFITGILLIVGLEQLRKVFDK